ncbi:MAG TPA: 7TM diverse intracellular signaling domain-containing protein [Flavisolibacter sp.]|nr:7TM diverse intracellular signaling domain-containing protein [Flavisolibacter sp.]
MYLLLAGHFAARAGVNLFVNEHPLSPQQLSVLYYLDSSSQRSYDRYRAIMPFMEAVPSKLNLSYKNEQVWLRLDLSNLPVSDSVVYLEINNPHINYLGAWILKDSNLVMEYPMTGDHLPFRTRNMNHAQFVYKINLKEKPLQLLLLVDKRNEQLHLPLNFFTDDEFMIYNRQNNMLQGLLVGISVFILLFTLFLYFNMRDRLYVYYTLYVLMVAGYIFTDFGLSFMFLYPDHPGIADYIRPFTISLAPIFYILFARALLEVNKHFPRIYQFTNGFTWFYLLSFVLAFTVIPNTGMIRIFWLVFMQVLMVLSIIPVFVFAALGYRKKIRYAGYIFFASLLFTISSQVYMQYITGNLPDTLITRNAVNLGFSVEICLLALALSLRFKNYKLHAEELLVELNRRQENIFKTVSEYQEKEMKRLSGLLHDSIGAGLSSIKFNLEALGDKPMENASLLRHTIDDVSTLTDEVRNISHSLSPVILQKKGLMQAVKDLITQYNRTGKIHIYFESIGSLEASAFQNELLVFRILQELMQNAVKHAHATEVLIQVMLEPELISIFVEDNGRGFDKGSLKEGLGFSQIKGLVTFVNGRFEVDSQVNKGCRISIEFPIIPHEATDKTIIGRRSPYVFGRG